MELPRDARFVEQAERYALRYRCEDCGLFDALRGCAHGYPTERHRQAESSSDRVVFCKDFEVV